MTYACLLALATATDTEDFNVLDENTLKPDAKENSGDAVDLDIDFVDGFNEEDLERMQAGTEGGGEAEAGNFSFNLNSDEDKGAANLEEIEPETTAAKNKMNLWLILGAMAGVLAVCAFIYFAMQVFGGSNQSGSNRQQSQFGQPLRDEVSTDDVEALANALGSAPPKKFESSPQEASFESPSQPSNPEQQVQPLNGSVNNDFEPNAKNILVTQGYESMVSAAAEVTSGTSLVEPSVSQVVTEEERLYDNLLTSVEGMDVPPEAIKIDQGVINRKLENQRINTLEQEVKEARSSMAGIKSAVEGMRNQVSGFAQAIENSSTEQAAISESITKLADQVKKATAVQEKELEAIKAAVAKAQASADKATAAAIDAKAISRIPAAVQQQVAAPVSAPAPTPKKIQVAPVAASQNVVVREPIAAATAPVSPTKVFSEQPTPAVVQAQTENQSASGTGLPAHCNGTRVSANWRVKGVNSHSAYVVRSQDQQGMYLKVGVDVPGYGQVQAFDANNRSVCTTNGLIRR